jgi:UDP-N-acetylmuramoyl-tripeptide--D-alanyl-D-alanine ligase
VENVLQTLQQLAHHHRKQLNIPFIAVCGSNGKTTTKELMYAVLSAQFRTVATKGNLNNHIGVPLTLLAIPGDTEIAVIEIGANHIGETADLCRIAAPGYGLVTNNGKDHLEGFGSIEGVRRANGELYEWLRTSGGLAFVNDRHPDLLEQSAGLKRKTYGSDPSSDYVIEPVQDTLFAAVQTQDPELMIRSQLAGQFNWENMATAIAIGKYFDVPDEKIKSALENYSPGMNRSQVVNKDGATYIVDCYNANPSSMLLALESFAALPGETKAVVLGDMLELGEYSRDEHRQIIERVKEMAFGRVILVGPYFGELAGTLNSIAFENASVAREWFRTQDWSGWMILLKGSRGYRLETILAPG